MCSLMIVNNSCFSGFDNFVVRICNLLNFIESFKLGQDRIHECRLRDRPS